MILESVRVTQYKNIRDTGEVGIRDGVTCLVGKNESGKTSLLEALYRLNPLSTGHPESFAPVRDYPRRHYARDRERVPAMRPVSATFILEESDIQAVDAAHGPGLLASRRVTVSRSYANETLWEFECDEGAVPLPPPVQGAEPRDASPREGGPSRDEQLHRNGGDDLGRTLTQCLPAFLYFDEYSVMPGRVSIARLQSAEEHTLGPSERTALSLFRLAGVDLSQFELSSYGARRAALEAAASEVTEEVLRYWSQNPSLSVELDIDFDGAECAPFLDIRIRNHRHRVTLNFSERSHGFTWFFSFVAALSELRASKRTVLLLDEPGRSLHAAAQRDLLRFIDERIAPSHQIVYSTHSPFMVSATHLEGVRTVEDREGAGRHVSHVFHDHSDETRLPLQASLGRELLRALPSASDTLLVEGPSDQVFLVVLSAHLERMGRVSLDPRWSVVPVGGLSGVCAFTALVEAGPNVAIIGGFHGLEDGTARSAAGSELLHHEGLVALAQITATPEADVEDLFAEPFYLDLVNRSNAAAVEAFEIRGEGRVVQRIGKATGAGFNRFVPARFLLEHPEALVDQADDATLERFETLFRTVNEFIDRGARRPPRASQTDESG